MFGPAVFGFRFEDVGRFPLLGFSVVLCYLLVRGRSRKNEQLDMQGAH